MAIKGFKDIINNKGYKVSSKDRKIFERELDKSLFGIGNGVWFRHGETDAIEFILYDSNDNQLPQGDDGKLVRYIYLDDANIKNYFTINTDETTRNKFNDSREYVVDSEKLIKEAGYSTGIFKTQITLLNRRAGSEERPFDKVWIHEISPSRTEIRVLPTKDNQDQVLPDLQERYNIFVSDGNFRDDTILSLEKFVESVDVQKVLESFLTIKGRVSEGQGYINLIKKEFGINNFDSFINTIRSKFIEVMRNFSANRDWDIDSVTYGKPLSTIPPIELSVSTILEISTNVIDKLLDKYLPKRNINETGELSFEDQITYDALKQILKSSTSDSIYSSTVPPSVGAVITGCTNPKAINFNPLAVIDDGSCIINIEPPKTSIRGCMDPKALNYNPLATISDGSCTYPTPSVPTTPTNPGRLPDATTTYRTKTYYVWSTSGSITYVGNDEKQHKINGIQGAQLTITYSTKIPLVFSGDVRDYQQISTSTSGGSGSTRVSGGNVTIPIPNSNIPGTTIYEGPSPKLHDPNLRKQ